MLALWLLGSVPHRDMGGTLLSTVISQATPSINNKHNNSVTHSYALISLP